MSSSSGRSEGFRNAATYPARAAARAWRGPLETAAEDVLASPEAGRVLDSALAGPLPEEFARSLVRHNVLERVMQELAAAGELERLVDRALASPQSVVIVDRVVASDAFRAALDRSLSGPELHAALASTSSGLADQVVGSVRRAAARLDVRISGATPSALAGVASRGLALVVDALVVAVLSLLLGAAVGLVASLFGGIRPHALAGSLLGAGGAIVAIGYFTLFWSTVGQTPGMRLAGVRVWGPRPDGSLTAGRAVVRTLGLALAIIPCFLGFVPALFDSRRRALPDYLASTVVRYDDGPAR
ncbi:MAG TPA: RDD family protein [Gaiellaceae bacterium]|jgi:uncharacterized RDD family membrane protein YckC